jgi:hypothetical protein
VDVYKVLRRCPVTTKELIEEDDIVIRVGSSLRRRERDELIRREGL